MTRMKLEDVSIFTELFSKAFRTVVWPFLKSILIRVHEDPEPVAALSKALKEQKVMVAGVAAVLAGAGGAAAGGVIAAASLGFWGGIGYWLGLVSLPLWGPVLGALAAAGGGGAGVYVLLSKLSERDRVKLATLYAYALTVIVFADGKQTETEQGQIVKLRDRLLGMGVPDSALSKIFSSAPRTADDFFLDPSDLPKGAASLVLTEVWLAAESAGSAGDQESNAFDRLCARLNIADQAELLRAEARKVTDEVVRRTPAIAVAAAFAAPAVWSGAAELFDELLAADFTGNALRQRAKIMSAAAALGAAAASIGAVASGHPDMLSIIGEGYAVGRAAVAGQPEEAKRTRGRALELLGQLGVERKQADHYLAKIDGVLDETAEEAEKATKMVAKARKVAQQSDGANGNQSA